MTKENNWLTKEQYVDEMHACDRGDISCQTCKILGCKYNENKRKEEKK